jgi:hypothetical protein
MNKEARDSFIIVMIALILLGIVLLIGRYVYGVVHVNF